MAKKQIAKKMIISLKSIQAWREVLGLGGWSHADIERIDWMLETIKAQRIELDEVKKELREVVYKIGDKGIGSY